MSKLKRKWLIYSVGGLLLMGTGMSVIGQAIIEKVNEAAFWTWFFWGTSGLVLFNAGVSIFGQAVVYRVKMGNKSHRRHHKPGKSSKGE